MINCLVRTQHQSNQSKFLFTIFLWNVLFLGMFELLTVLWPSQDWREYCKKKAQWSWMWRTRVFTFARAKTPRFFNQFLLDNRVHSEYKVWFYDPEKQPRIQQNLMVGAKQHFLEPIHISWSLRVVMLGRLWNLPKLEIGRGVKLDSDKSRFQVKIETSQQFYFSQDIFYSNNTLLWF